MIIKKQISHNYREQRKSLNLLEAISYADAMANLIDELQAQIDTERASLFAESQRKQQLQEDYAAQGLALKAAKAMQQAETERANANELDAKHYIAIRDATVAASCGDYYHEVELAIKKAMHKSDEEGRNGDLTTDDVDSAIDSAIATYHATIQSP